MANFSGIVGAAAVGTKGGATKNEDGIALTSGGKKYTGWKTARVTRSIEAISGVFELNVSDLSSGDPWPIRQGDSCEVSINGATVISGRVDKRSMSIGEGEHSISVAGRDQAADLVDCSAYLDAWEFKNVSLKQLAEKLCAPFGIGVFVQDGLTLPKAAPKVRVTPGDNAFGVLEEACRLAGVLPISNGAGGIILTRAGSSRVATELVQGVNILQASATYDHSQRFGRYVVLGQRAATDEDWGETVAAVKGEAIDPDMARDARVLVVRPEGNVTDESARTRAQWEATVRAARAVSVSVKVQGWASKELWPVNALVGVCAPTLEIGKASRDQSGRVQTERVQQMLITAATYEVSRDGGTTTTLTLRHPDAFNPEPPQPPAGGDRPWKELP